jgi:hypothetical protein
MYICFCGIKHSPDTCRAFWVPNVDQARIGQSRSGESGKTYNKVSRATVIHTAIGQSGIWPCRANRAGWAIGQIGQIGRSGKRANRAIGPLEIQS